ncbi:hypothetical protein BD311DRAFT_743436 [Dichomitus squalens]|uniref:Uncharacterized protein n=1 Tax=Dichomitus squalens TaxID=114155 RepID=A0A4Q9M758_9APHY|nr:hypothetical protein BD311DRAFT_743436 [Dichomitus squalens]
MALLPHSIKYDVDFGVDGEPERHLTCVSTSSEPSILASWATSRRTGMVILPTADIMLAVTSEHEVLQWIELAEGDALRACDISDSQRDIVLKILYAYRVTSSDIELFFRLVAEAAMALDDHEPADVVLEDLVDYIDTAFPSDALETALHRPRPPVTCTSLPAVASASLPSDTNRPTAPLRCPMPAPTVAGMRVRPPRPLSTRSHAARPVSPVHRSLATISSLTAVLSPSALAAETSLSGCAPARPMVSQDDGWTSDNSVPDLESVAGSESDGEEPYIFTQNTHPSFEELVELNMQEFMSRLSRQ